MKKGTILGFALIVLFLLPVFPSPVLAQFWPGWPWVPNPYAPNLNLPTTLNPIEGPPLSIVDFTISGLPPNFPGPGPGFPYILASWLMDYNLWRWEWGLPMWGFVSDANGVGSGHLTVPDLPPGKYWIQINYMLPLFATVTFNITERRPTIEDIKVTGFPDQDNPTTNCPSTNVVEKVKLEAVTECPPNFEITEYSWSGKGIEAGKGNPYEYVAATETYGQKTVTCTMSFRNTQNGWSGSITKTQNFKLFFVKDGYDQGAGKPPNWFLYWSQIVEPSLLGSPKPKIVYNAAQALGLFCMGETSILIGHDNAKQYNAPLGSHNPLDGIDHFVWAVVHESQHYKDACDYWGNNYANYRSPDRLALK
jgi:hypothetical protein